MLPEICTLKSASVADRWSLRRFDMIRDLKTYTNGVVDVTPEAVLANSVNRVNRTLVTIRIGGTFVPVGVLPIVPVRGTPGQSARWGSQDRAAEGEPGR